MKNIARDNNFRTVTSQASTDISGFEIMLADAHVSQWQSPYKLGHHGELPMEDVF